MSLVNFLLERDADVNIAVKKGLTAVFMSIYSRNNTMLKALIGKGAQVNVEMVNIAYCNQAIIRSNISPLMLALFEHAPVTMIKTLIDAQANITELFRSNIGNETITPVLYAAKYYYAKSSFNCVKALAEAGANVNDQDKDGMSVMHWAISRNDLKLVKFLIGKVNLNLKETKHGENPLQYAISTMQDFDEQRNKIILELLKTKDKAHIVNPDNGKPLLASILYHGEAAKEVADLLFENEDMPFEAKYGKNGEGNVLIAAVMGEFNRYIEILLKVLPKEFLDYQDHYGRTALMCAAANRSKGLAMVKSLCEAGADPGKKDNDGKTALNIARNRQAKGIVNFLTQNT